jgi:alcohol dehydrogenase
VAVGSRVTWALTVGCGGCFFCAADLPQKCERLYKYGHQHIAADRPTGGGLADSVLLVPGTFWLHVPDALPDAVAAPANCATATAAAALRAGGPGAGRTVLILGGGVLGVTAAAMARTAGAAAVLVGDPVAACRDRARQFGATHAFPPGEALTAGTQELTAGRGADLVLELAGVPGTVEVGLALTRTGGTLILAGTVAPGGAVVLDPEQVVRRLLTIRGVHNYHPGDLAAALDFLAGPGQAYPWETLVAATYPLGRAEEAFAEAHRRPGVRVAVVPETDNPGGPRP